MALTATMYRFSIDVADVDRGIYQPLELRVAKHPSESNPFLLTRVIAYVLNLEEGIGFSKGISTPDEPAIWIRDLTGSMTAWIDIGNPAPKRLHKASKAADRVRIYTYKDPAILIREVRGQEIYRIEQIECYAIASKFLTELELTLQRDNPWKFLHTEGELSITAGGTTVHGELTAFRLT